MAQTPRHINVDVSARITPTQVRRPWRATLRTVVQGLIAFCVLLPFLVEATGLDPQVYPWLAGVLAVAAAVTRVMALPQVEQFLRRFVPFLAAEPPAADRERGAGSVLYVAVLVLVLLLIGWMIHGMAVAASR